MGKLLHYRGYTAADCCWIDSDTREVCQLALELDADALAQTSLAQLEAAQDALLACERDGCDEHVHERVAREYLSAAIGEEMARLEAADERDADNHGHAGACACTQCC